MSKQKAPSWSKKAAHIMIDKNMTKKELAKALKVNYSQLVAVMGGITINDSIRERICTYLGIEQ